MNPTSPSCRACLEPTDAEGAFHPQCADALFGRPAPPAVDVRHASRLGLSAQMLRRRSLSGVQSKLSVGYDSTRTTLQVTVERAEYILKLAGDGQDPYPSLPANEHITMSLARAAGLPCPPFGLIRLADGHDAYLIRRFDRPAEEKLHFEDCCQLGEMPAREKYKGSIEQCARLLRADLHDAESGLAQLFRLVVFSWLVTSYDLHRKNMGLLRLRGGRYEMAPVYDVVCAGLYPNLDAQLALTVNGRRSKLNRRDWHALAKACLLSSDRADEAIADVSNRVKAHSYLVARSYLPRELAARYEGVVQGQLAALERAGA